MKTFDWKVFIALCLLALVPAIYQTVITKLITSNVDISKDIASSLELSDEDVWNALELKWSIG